MQLTAKRLSHIPHAPGVYTFTKRGVPIYVGKAADLCIRLGAYTPGKDWKTQMLREATGLRIERTDSELEALLLEANRITVFRPKYNIANRDQKSFLSILVTTDEEFPQVLPTRSHVRAGTYFGPFTSAHAVRETLRALRKIFPFRCKLKPQADSPDAAVGIPTRSRRDRKPQALLPLSSFAKASGDTSLPLHRGRGEKNSFPISHRPSAQRALRLEEEGGREGVGDAHASRLTPHARPCLYFHLGQCAGTCAGLITAAEYRRRVIAPLLRILRGQAKSARRLLDPDHRRLLDDVLAHTRVLSVTEKYAADLHDLQRVLHLPSLPHRIEGYDISNIHGLEAVGSMVVAIDGEPAPSEYKRFKIKALEGRSNDVGMLREVLTRRLTHAPSPTRSPSREGEKKGVGVPREVWPLPDLILIDGGKAQLNAVLRVMRKMGIRVANSEHSDRIRSIRMFPEVAVVALAKREEEVYLPGERAPLRLPRNSPALHLLQRVRDEAHRFAIRYHRVRYRKRMLRG